MSRPRVVLLLFALLALGLLPAATAQPAAAAPKTAKIAWSPCYDGFQCGILNVPLDYDDPSGPAISLALIRLPATDPARRIGSLFVNPGGPGGSGVDFVQQAGRFLFTPDVRASFDIVGFDPRGIARSTALRCFGNQKQWAPLALPGAFPMTPDEEQMWMAADAHLNDACDQRGGRIEGHMSTANVARDLDQMRQAVGDAGLTYAGYSYGSYLGATYANLFPNNVRALVVDGVLDPIAWSTGRNDEAATLPFSTRLKSADGAQATLDEFFRLCDAGACAFGPDSAARFAALAETLKTDPLVIPQPDGTTFVFNYSLLIGNALGAMYDSASWPDFADFLAFLEAQVGLASLPARAAQFAMTPAYLPKRGNLPYSNGVEGFPSVACSDSDNPDSYAAWSAAGAEADLTGYFGRLWTWVTSPCAVWNGADADRYMGPFDHETANPVLVVGNLFDPATPYHGAQIVHSLLPDSYLLTVHGWGHTSLFLSQCADAAIAAYLIDGDAPPADCYQDWTPFAP